VRLANERLAIRDCEPIAVRPALRAIGSPTNNTTSYRLDSITAHEMVLVTSDGTRETWTRAPAD